MVEKYLSFQPTDKQLELRDRLASDVRHTLVYGGSRCVSGDTVLDGHERTIAELADIGKPVMVYTSHGIQVAECPYLKGFADLLRIEVDGRVVSVTSDHRFWDGVEWVRAEDLSVGDEIAVCGSVSFSSFENSFGDLSELHQLMADDFALLIDGGELCDTPDAGGYRLRKVQSITAAPKQNFYTLHVPNCEHYYANGILHHNSGKTFWYLLAVISRALSEPNTKHLVARHTFQSIKESLWYGTWDKVMDLCFPEAFADSIKENKDLFFKELPNGSRIHFAGLNDDARVEKILGNEYSTIYFNECSEISFDVVSTVLSRLAEKSGLVQKAFYDCNPTDGNHWTYMQFVEKLQPMTGLPLGRPDDYQMFQMNPLDNKSNLDDAYLRSLEELPAEKRKRFLLGEYETDLQKAVYKREWFKEWLQPPSNRMIVCAWDTASKEAEANDPSCGLVWAIMPDGYYLIDMISRRMDYPTLRAEVVAVAEKYKADKILIEDRGSGIVLCQDLKSATKLPIVPFNIRNVSKFDRAKYSSHLFEDGKVFLPPMHPLLNEYKSQLLMFPYGKHDDYVDSTSMFLKYAIDNLVYDDRASYYEDVDYEEEMSYLADSRNPITGY